MLLRKNTVLLVVLLVGLGTQNAHAQELFADQVIAQVCFEPNANEYRIDLNGPNHAFEKYLKCGRYQRALELISNNPNRFRDEKLCSKTLATLFLLRRYTELISFGEKYLRTNPKCPRAIVELVNDYMGSAYSLQGDAKKADSCFKKAKIITDGSSENKSIGMNLRLMIEMTTGMPVIEMISTKAPRQATANPQLSKAQDTATLAKLAEDRGDYTGALALYSKAVKQYSSNPELYGALGVCQMSQAVLSTASAVNELKAARQNLEYGRRLNSKSWRIQNNLAICCYLVPDAVSASSELHKLKVFRELPSDQLESVNSLIETCGSMRQLEGK